MTVDLRAEILADVYGSLLAELGPAPDWQRDALCREPAYATVTWYPERGQPTQPAKDICARCTVRPECLEYALANSDKHGVWGGTSERQRRRLRTQRSAA